MPVLYVLGLLFCPVRQGGPVIYTRTLPESGLKCRQHMCRPRVEEVRGRFFLFAGTGLLHARAAWRVRTPWEQTIPNFRLLHCPMRTELRGGGGHTYRASRGLG